MFIYRPEYYRIFEDDAGSTLGMADIIVAKHRSGETGEVRLRFVAQYAKFENRESEGRYNMATGLQPNTGFDNGGAVILESKMNRDIDNTSNAENEGMFQ